MENIYNSKEHIEQMKLSIDDTLLQNIINYCKINKISDDIKFFRNMLVDAFNIIQYGQQPFPLTNQKIENINDDKIIRHETIPMDSSFSIIESPITNEITLIENKKKVRNIKIK